MEPKTKLIVDYIPSTTNYTGKNRSKKYHKNWKTDKQVNWIEKDHKLTGQSFPFFFEEVG